MARAAVKAKQQARAKAQPPKAARGRRRHAGGGNPNEQLFFTRLRRRQKYIYLVLAIVFAATFAGVGVGSGSGAGLDQLYSGIFGGGSDAVSKAQSEIKTNPRKGYLDLAQAYQTKGDIPNAIYALQNYLKIDGKNVGVWEQLAGYELQQGGTYAAQYQAAQQATQLADPSSTFQPTGPLTGQLGTNPISQYYTQQSSTQTSQLSQQAIGAFSTALRAYQTVAKYQPHNAQAQFNIAQAAERTGQYPVALKALQRFVQLDPHSPQLALIQQQCKQLGGSCTPKRHKK